MNYLARILGVLAVLVCGQVCAQPPAPARQVTVRPALDGVFDAFKTHPLVGLGDAHGLVQGMDFYAALVRDPRFARDVGNVVAEFGASAHQGIMDRYLAGESVPYTELRKVWTDTVGAIPTAGNIGFAKFFAVVRQINKSLPAAKRIRVWLGEPPLDWSVEKPEWLDAMRLRDSYPANLILENILAKGKKALVIYGVGHFTEAKDPGGGGMLYGRIKDEYPNAFFLALPYGMFHQPAGCGPLLKQAEKIWPAAALAVFAQGAALDPGMQECATWVERLFMPPGAAAPAQPVGPPPVTQRFDSVLFFGPPQSLTMTGGLPEYALDTEYRLEMYRRSKAGGLPFIRWPKGWSYRKADYEVDLDAPGYAERLDAMFAKFDRNEDGLVTEDEYVDPVPVR